MIDVVGIGLDGAAGISTAVQRIVEQATFLVGSDRHLNYFPHHPARRWVLGELHQGIAAIRAALALAYQIEAEYESVKGVLQEERQRHQVRRIN